MNLLSKFSVFLQRSLFPAMEQEAGGNLAAMVATHHAREDRPYPPADAADQVTCRPDFVMLVAPAYLTDPIVSSTLDPAPELDKVARNLTPPIFITSATTDKFTVGASPFPLALREHHIPWRFISTRKAATPKASATAPTINGPTWPPTGCAAKASSRHCRQSLEGRFCLRTPTSITSGTPPLSAASTSAKSAITPTGSKC